MTEETAGLSGAEIDLAEPSVLASAFRSEPTHRAQRAGGVFLWGFWAVHVPVALIAAISLLLAAKVGISHSPAVIIPCGYAEEIAR
jgi:hypothetical protein